MRGRALAVLLAAVTAFGAGATTPTSASAGVAPASRPAVSASSASPCQDDGTNTYLAGSPGAGYEAAGVWWNGLTDLVGSPVRYVSTAGAATTPVHYDPYGAPRPGSTVGAGIGYGGEYRDPTGLLNLRARSYDPVLARFIGRDTYGGVASAPQTGNRYAYALANPLRYTDPTGHFVNNVVLNPRAWLFIAAVICPPIGIAVCAYAAITGYDPIFDRQLSPEERVAMGALACLGVVGELAVGAMGVMRAAEGVGALRGGAELAGEAAGLGRLAEGAGAVGRLGEEAGAVGRLGEAVDEAALVGRGATVEEEVAGAAGVGSAVGREAGAAGQVAYGSTDLSRAVISRRITDGGRLGQTGNYAAARLEDGTVLTGRSGSGIHAEEDLLSQASGRRVVDLYSEREPCAMRCGPAIARQLAPINVTWTWPWNGIGQGARDDVRRLIVDALVEFK